ncbi:APC family permease [Opitutaceae bacterium EW11]|nr:APC family permease [Opitutaceae bacterium EW11]
MSLKETFFGKRLRSEAEQEEQIGPFAAVPVLGLDALASASYGPEAALTVLLPLGAAASSYVVVVACAVVAVLLIVFFSYRQTIPAYPQGGGSFTVAKDNLGTGIGLLAASALAIDYVLNVAVAISAGVGALVSAAPKLFPHSLALCLGILAVITVVNLRGIRSAGLVFMTPTYLFVGTLGITILIGIWKTVGTGGHPQPVETLPAAGAATAAASVWIVLRAFASGCTALTGIEAVSNAVPVFRQPKIENARRTLTAIMAVLAFLVIGGAVVARAYGIHATVPGHAGYQSVLSQIVASVVGRGWFYYLMMTAVLLVLALSANTSFADFPRVCRVLAQDEYLPAEFAHRGSRLVYTAGILLLAGLSGALLVLFGGITDRLIPLFAVGAFLAFTLSQLGMVFHWRRRGGPGAMRSLIVNAVGALATGTTLIVIAVAKFREGAWITILVIPPLLLLFRRVRRYHETLDRETDAGGPLDVRGLLPPVVVIPLKRMDAVARKALRLAITMSSEVRAVQIVAEEMKTEDLSASWDTLVEEPARAAGYKPPFLTVVRSPYREFFSPLLRALKDLGEEYPDRTIAVMLPEVVERRWYHFLFRHRATFLKALLLMRGGPRIALITTPWYLQEAAHGEKLRTPRSAKDDAVTQVVQAPAE